MGRDRENLGEWRRMNYLCGKEKADDETGQKVLVGGGSRTDKRSECGDVRGMMSLSWPSPLLGQVWGERQQRHIQHVSEGGGSHQAPAKATRTQLQEHVAGKMPVSHGASTVFALALARQTRSTRKEAECRWQPAWLGWATVFCLTGATAWVQRQREKCCSDNSNQHSQGEVWAKASNGGCRKAEEEIVQVKKQDRGNDTGMHLEMSLGTELEQGLWNFPRNPWKRMFLSSPLSHFRSVRGTWGL